MEETFTVFGSKEDLESFQTAMKAAGFEPVLDEYIYATGGGDIALRLTYIIVPAVTTCVVAWLKITGKRMVTRMGDKIIIQGNFSAEEVERLLLIPYSVDIENDIELPQEPSNSEGEIGFHVGMKKKPENKQNP